MIAFNLSLSLCWTNMHYAFQVIGKSVLFASFFDSGLIFVCLFK